MDNSTSMLQSDQSTALAGQANHLESQDRVSLYAYQQALEKAGYGFSRKGESGVLSTAAFKDAVIKNSAADLAEVLNDFEAMIRGSHQIKLNGKQANAATGAAYKRLLVIT